MPRAGGDADKLGNRYEGIWTIGRLLELAAGKSESLKVEPTGEEALGIEFVVRDMDGTREFHSVKRQQSRGEWSLADLTRENRNTGRSILKDLLGKLSQSGTHKCCFVSSTGANDLRELGERARRCHTLPDFENDLKSSDPLRQIFEKRFLPITSDDRALAYEFLQRMRVVLIDEATLTRQVEQHIAYLVYRPDLCEFSGTEVRVLLGDFIVGSLGNEIRHDAIWEFLSQYGYAKRDWATDTTIRDVVRQWNQRYVRTVEFELINGSRISRKETQTIVDEVRRGDGARRVLVSAAAGVGKSCVITQAVGALEAHDVPVLVVRMDRHGDARTTQDIGTQMELPRSPAITLAGIANGGDSVLVVDQLDAVSQVSGRYPHLWEVFDSLCEEAAAYPNMRLVIACRDFDLQHDPRLRKLKQPEIAKPVAVQPLSIEDVDVAIRAAGCAEVRLGLREKELLRTPLHLFLFLDGLGDSRTVVGFRDIGELFDRYWERKCKLVSDRVGATSAWTTIIDKLCEVMSRNLTVYVPAVIVDDWSDSAAAMLTEHVLVCDRDQIRFFHESFFDYAFARRFCATDKDLVTLLHSDEQHLFRRSQVRQILTFLRDHAPSQYLGQLRNLLSDPGIRFHIKRLVIVWLGTLPDPKFDEWGIVEPLLSESDICRHVLPSIRNSLAWFDVLYEGGVISRWLESADEDTINRGVWFLMFDEVQKQRSEIAAALLAPYCGRSSEWAKRLCAYFRHGNAHCSRSIQELFLRALDEGIFEKTSANGRDSWWNRLRDAAEHAPLFALEAITHWLDRRIAEAPAQLKGVLERRNHDQTAIRLINAVAKREPTAYIEQILPRVLTIVNLTAIPSDDGLRLDSIWLYRSNHEPTYVSESVLDELVGAFEKLATEDPEKVDMLTAGLLKTDSDTVTYLLLRTWSANPARFGDTCIQFLAADDRCLDIGYSLHSGGGNGSAAISREAILACLSYAAVENRDQLERTIIGLALRGEEGKYKGWTNCLLLEAFGEEHLSKLGRDLLIALRDKFPQQDITIPPRRCSNRLSRVESPIPPDQARQLTDDQWLCAMRAYDYGWDDSHRRQIGVDHELRGSAVELSRQLQPQARRERRRFAALTIDL